MCVCAWLTALYNEVLLLRGEAGLPALWASQRCPISAPQGARSFIIAQGYSVLGLLLENDV